MGSNYRQYCPIARASEILAERWNPLIVRNLMFGAVTFSAIAKVGHERSSRSAPGRSDRAARGFGWLTRLERRPAAPVRDPGGLPGQCLIATLR